MFKSFKKLFAPNLIPRSIRHYQNAKPPNQEERLKLLQDRRAKDLFDALVLALGKRTSLSVDEWKEFRSKSKVQRQGDNAVLTAIKSLDITQNPLKIAESYIEAFDIKRNVIVNRIFIDLYAAKAARIKLTQTEEEELTKMCNELIENEMYLLPEVTGTVINGLCATREWKRALALSTDPPQPKALNLLIRKAMRENEYEIVWELLEKLTSRHPNELQQKTIDKYWHFSAKKNTTTLEYVEKMLRLLGKCEIVLIEPVANTLMDILKRSGCEAKRIQMDFSGKCPSCAKNLAENTITDDEFKLVRQNFEKKVVRGVDLYHKTTPDEWNAFMKLIKKNGPYDIVVDGLNVSFKSNYGSIQQKIGRARANYNLLIDAVKQLKQDGIRVLVIGRKHMKRWPGMKNLYRVTRNVFLVDNISKDEIFLLYGAMHSGPNAYILSNDYMRNYKWAMGRRLEVLFKKWQQQRTVGFTFNRNNSFHPVVPMQFKLFCHQIDDQWHIPFVGDEERNQFNHYALPKHWICFRP